MEQIDKQIEWYENNSTGTYDEVVRIELTKINDLHDAFDDMTDDLFVREMIAAFCKIIETQRERIADLESELSAGSGSFAFCTPANPQNGKQLQEAFTAYCLKNGKSTYTANDYCSRIKNLWNAYSQESKATEQTAENDPLWNAFLHAEPLDRFIAKKIEAGNGARNWANTRAAFRKFSEFCTTLQAQ